MFFGTGNVDSSEAVPLSTLQQACTDVLQNLQRKSKVLQLIVTVILSDVVSKCGPVMLSRVFDYVSGTTEYGNAETQMNK